MCETDGRDSFLCDSLMSVLCFTGADSLMAAVVGAELDARTLASLPSLTSPSSTSGTEGFRVALVFDVSSALLILFAGITYLRGRLGLNSAAVARNMVAVDVEGTAVFVVGFCLSSFDSPL